MKKYFNISGPCVPEEHYMLPTQERCRGIPDLIEQEQYFVIHAARQSGKTTLLKELTRQLQTEGSCYPLYCSLETLRGISAPEEGIPRLLDEVRSAVQDHEYLGNYAFAEQIDPTQYTVALRRALSNFCRQIDKPLVMFFDEVDCLANGTLIAFLQQLRYGYINRSEIPFVHSIALVGMRNIRDYKGKLRDERETLGSSSPFNIVTESLTLRNFNRQEIERLYAQHTEQSGQRFAPDVVDAVYLATQGQPWLVNAIAREIVVKILANDPSLPIAVEHVEQAAQRIILRRDTHIDSLMERLREERVQRIVEPVIIGDIKGYSQWDDDYRYVLDLGLLREVDKQLVPSNPIYGEVMIRSLNARSQMEFEQQRSPSQAPAYLVDGRLNMQRLLEDFQCFWRENSEIWVEKSEYKEAAPHLILQAFLQRIINSGGRITREMAAGTRRLDLCVHYQQQRYPIELKLRYSDAVYEDGKEQLNDYLDKLGCAEGWLIVFDRRQDLPWEKKGFWTTNTFKDKTIHIVGC